MSAELAAATGMSLAEAVIFMEMAGNNLEQAVAMHFSMADEVQPYYEAVISDSSDDDVEDGGEDGGGKRARTMPPAPGGPL